LSQFKKWDEVSWVRSKDRRIAPFSSNLDFFARQCTGLFSSPEVLTADPVVQRELLVLQLYNYLEFTVWLELGPVNEVCNLIRRPDFLAWLPTQMKDDALRIYVDEGAHAEMCRSLIVAVEDYNRVKSLKLKPSFLDVLDTLVKRELPDFHPLIKLFLVIISETLITGTLSKLPRDHTVQLAVREVVADHATDEGRHHAYFLQLFEYVWHRFPQELRRHIGLLLPEMILAFLEPDARAIGAMLGRFPAVFDIPGKLAADLVRSETTRLGIQSAALPGTCQ